LQWREPVERALQDEDRGVLIDHFGAPGTLAGSNWWLLQCASLHLSAWKGYDDSLKAG
jgi:hypothetical protein